MSYKEDIFYVITGFVGIIFSILGIIYSSKNKISNEYLAMKYISMTLMIIILIMSFILLVFKLRKLIYTKRDNYEEVQSNV